MNKHGVTATEPASGGIPLPLLFAFLCFLCAVAIYAYSTT